MFTKEILEISSVFIFFEWKENKVCESLSKTIYECGLVSLLLYIDFGQQLVSLMFRGFPSDCQRIYSLY